MDVVTDDKHFCACGKHYYHYALKKYVAVLSSGLVILKEANWPACVQAMHASRVAASEHVTLSEVDAAGK